MTGSPTYQAGVSRGGTMNTTAPTNATAMSDQVPTSDPGTSHGRRRRTAAAVAGATVAAGVAVATSATPALAYINNQHNETLVRSRRRRRTAAAVAGGTVAAGVAVAVSATPTLAYISNQHNETLVRSPGGS
jgi:hypothetical protein